MLYQVTTSQSVSAITNSHGLIPDNLRSTLPSIEEGEEELSRLIDNKPINR